MSDQPLFEETEPVSFEDTQPLEDELPSFEETDPSPTAEGAIGAMGYGAVEGVPFAKDVLAAGEALFEDERFGEAYNSNKQEWDEKINEAEENHPVAFNVGDIGANIGLGLLPGGKLLGTAKGAMAFGAASSLSRSERRDPFDAFSGVLLGGGGHILGKALGATSSAVGGFLNDFGKAGVPEAVGGISVGARSRFNKLALRNYLKPDGNMRSAISEMADDVLTGVADDGYPVIKGVIQGPFTTSQRAGQAKNRLGKKIGAILDMADNAEIKVKGEDVYTKLITDMGIDDASLNSKQSELMLESLQTLRKKVDREFISGFKNGPKIGTTKKIVDGVEVIEDVYEKTPIYKERTLKELHDLKSEMGEILGKRVEKAKANLGTASIEEETLLTQLGILSDVIGDTVEKSTVTSKEAFKKLNRQYNTLRITEEIAKENWVKSQAGPFSALQDAINTKGLILGGLSHAAGMSKAVSAALGISFNTIIKSPKTPPAIAKSLMKISEVIKGNPDHEFTKRIIQASALGSDKLRLAIESAEAELMLNAGPEAKLDRTSDSVLTNSDQVLTILEYHAPDKARELRSYIKDDNREGIGSIMEEISKLPNAKDFIKDGMGWDGKVRDEQSKIELENSLMRMDMSTLQRSKHLKELRQNGTIPQVQQEPNRFMKYQTRDKKRPQF